MSTKAIREALEMMGHMPTNVFGSAADAKRAHDILKGALAEVEAIERVAKDLDRLAIGDGVYDVCDRDKTLRETPDGQSTWDHPDVKAWGDAAKLLRSIAKDAP